MIRKSIEIRMFAYILILFCFQATYAIRVSPGVITVRGIPVVIDTSLGIPLTLYNDENMDLVYTVRVMKPSQVKKHWRDGFEEIPDTNWIYLADGNEFVVPANGMVSSMVRIRIPDSDAYYNQMWAVYLLVTAESGSMFNTAVAPLFMLETKTLTEPNVPPAGIPGSAPSAVTLSKNNPQADITLYNTTDSALTLSLSSYIPSQDKSSAEIEPTAGWQFDDEFMKGIEIEHKSIKIKPGDNKKVSISATNFPSKKAQALLKIEGAPVIRFIRIFYHP
ncbi:hypothetical protein J7L68_07800 [bacterium]|nr:hypothetical protein [bacterium]